MLSGLSKKSSLRFAGLAGLIVLAALSRLLPHLPNFTPIAAMALFGGAKLNSRSEALGVVLGAMLLSDLVLGFDVISPVVYFSLAVIVLAGRFLKRTSAVSAIAGMSLAGSTIFFVITNFGVWALQGMYPKSAAGLMECYTMAIPFFHSTAAGDLFFTAVLFGLWAVVERRVPAVRAEAAA